MSKVYNHITILEICNKFEDIIACTPQILCKASFDTETQHFPYIMYLIVAYISQNKQSFYSHTLFTDCCVQLKYTFFCVRQNMCFCTMQINFSPEEVKFPTELPNGR
jgi:hypothetical protein